MHETCYNSYNIYNQVMSVADEWGGGDYYAGGGSGRVTPLRVSTPLEGIQKRAGTDFEVIDFTGTPLGSAGPARRAAHGPAQIWLISFFGNSVKIEGAEIKHIGNHRHI